MNYDLPNQYRAPEAIEHLPTDTLVPYARNSRTHSPEQVAQIAASIKEFGFTNPVLIDANNTLIAGHGRVMAAQSIGLSSVPAIRLAHLTDAQRRAYVIADNKLAENAGWDMATLAREVEDLNADGYDLELLGFGADELTALLGEYGKDAAKPGDGLTDPDEAPTTQAEVITQTGDVWILGKHRAMCGDSTSAGDVALLMAGRKAALIHADPPYGMGKQSDGVLNDNLYVDQLDSFQLSWWSAFRPHLISNASAYIWGNSPDLWRLWYQAGLGDLERFEIRNHITWDKKNIAGRKSPDLMQFPIATEHCLFFQFGVQFAGNINTEDFPENWEPIRLYLEGQAKDAGIKPADIKAVCGCGMYSHWFTKAQFTLIPETHYATLQTHFPGFFLRPWADLKREWARVSSKSLMHEKLGVVRSYFDNAHDVMHDVWSFPRVHGEERHGHATPKPVAMMERAIKSACPPGGLCVEPFGGSGSTLMGAETTGRSCYVMEMQGKYVDVIVRRWQQFTGKTATLESTGQTFDQVQAQRLSNA